ncbi:hypothetical protein ABVK25_002110 [Lepraria finkii]|uniref:Uncharacterized protein n=1 Tax=Lepraria finkii TaxID=1340010 RepID=A0ABR4BL32_9LECA
MNLAPMRPQAFRSTIYQKASAFDTAVGDRWGVRDIHCRDYRFATPPRSREKIHDTPECGNTCPRPASRQRMSAVGTISTIREQAGEERYFRGQKYGSKALSLKAGVFIPVIWVFL